ncbi:TIGR03842 family LLM class F420-dependent oxidoreductase [Candidatus Chloroploca sp. M-50]|uniref:TIGR03842 family LLM class F420-dependent oxidoreductase n=1 Tax=Candidatus Chloroploca mongolica TaxID=2528176 RepID=A0ABS4D7H2_9CHLR|nr:TIGR03842 family LLM class F420-dependent oxidoreductase [Candidatus Chloroploca mongolica]MBP1465392.1 TIGR03842 family LLM class F420-dependent oxidoreductase [Candidatus Chloroploca mongolica]
MEFAITLKLDMPPTRSVALTKQAEEAGFRYAWVFDSHVLWQDPYPLLTLMAHNTQHMRLGTCVTNPAVRDLTVTASSLATLNLISGGRMDLGIGRGDSSRRVLGKKPTTLADLEVAALKIRALATGRPVTHEEQTVQLPWACQDTCGPTCEERCHPEPSLPIWIAAYGPKALHLTGRIADGVILQFADPALIKWCLGFLHEGARAAGRDPAAIKVMAAAPVWVADDLAYARNQVRWFPALVSNHVVDLLARYDQTMLPPELTQYVSARAGYDYQKHAEVGSSNAEFVTDDVVDRFCIVGPVEEHRRRLHELAALGVHQFNIYLMSGEEEACLEVYGSQIVPAFGSASKLVGS